MVQANKVPRSLREAQQGREQSELQHQRLQIALDTALECAICKDGVEDPILLQCGHTFCRRCLEQSGLQHGQTEHDFRAKDSFDLGYCNWYILRANREINEDHLRRSQARGVLHILRILLHHEGSTISSSICQPQGSRYHKHTSRHVHLHATWLGQGVHKHLSKSITAHWTEHCSRWYSDFI